MSDRPLFKCWCANCGGVEISNNAETYPNVFESQGVLEPGDWFRVGKLFYTFLRWDGDDWALVKCHDPMADVDDELNLGKFSDDTDMLIHIYRNDEDEVPL